MASFLALSSVSCDSKKHESAASKADHLIKIDRDGSQGLIKQKYGKNYYMPLKGKNDFPSLLVVDGDQLSH